MPNNVKSCKKIDEKAQTAKFTVLQGEISSAVLKTWKTRKTKTWITQFFQILYAIQGTTMSTLTSQGFRKCGTFWVYDFLKGSYWLSKSSQISRKKMGRRRCYKKKELPQFWVFGSETNSRCSPPYELPWLFVSCPKNQNCDRVFFLQHLLWPNFFFEILLDFDGQ